MGRSSPPGPAGGEPADPTALVGLLADDARLRCFAAVVLGARTTGEVAAATGLDPRSTVTALERLAGGGLVAAGEGGLLAVPGRFGEAARAAARDRPQVRPEELGATPAQAAVLRSFLTPEGRLTRLPSSVSKRRVVLDFLAGRFEPGRAYPEAEVTFLLGQVHPDYASLRRALVDEGFLDRREGFYWRSGGSFEVE